MTGGRNLSDKPAEDGDDAGLDCTVIDEPDSEGMSLSR